MTLESAISELRVTLGSSRTAASWRRRVRQQLANLKDALREERFASRDGWLAARSGTRERERRQLAARLTALGSGLLDRLDTERVEAEAQRLIADIERYRQRMHDLVYDAVGMEIGGSE